ncbi:MAG: hypothetical protein Q7T48_19955 [Cellvibrio sp.]|uniref:hypothetical protein n=1 Tax=Cellvibrio sp. TaxID=1965322 RepID=UPI002716EECA|nr:hypothetical protein [Cellvibrio sp.]
MVLPVIEIILSQVSGGCLHYYCRWFDGATISQMPDGGQLLIDVEGLETENTPVS